MRWEREIAAGTEKNARGLEPRRTVRNYFRLNWCARRYLQPTSPSLDNLVSDEITSNQTWN